MFAIGELVCYPMHGVGSVEAIEEQTVLGETSQYYRLRFFTGRMTAMVPVATVERVGLRRLAEPDVCETVIRSLAEEPSVQESDNWNQRYRDNLERLHVGKVQDVANVVKCLVKRDREKGLSAGERKMYLTARQVLLGELSVATGRTEEELLPLVGGA